MQSRKGSAFEVVLNYASGFTVAWILTQYVLPLYGYMVTKRQGFEITIIFTIVSIIRTYFWRRLFNRYMKGKSNE